MWDKEQWGVFFIFTGFLIPLGIVFLVQSRLNSMRSKHTKDIMQNDTKYRFLNKTFINGYNKSTNIDMGENI